MTPSRRTLPRPSLDSAFFGTARGNCEKMGGELITGRKVRRKIGRRRNYRHGGTKFCKSRAVGSGVSRIFVMPVMALNFGWSIYRWKLAAFSLDGLVSVLAAAALVVLVLYARLFALKVQDRVIRMEERIRLEKLLPRRFEAAHRRVHQRPTCGYALRLRRGKFPRSREKYSPTTFAAAKPSSRWCRPGGPDYLRA